MKKTFILSIILLSTFSMQAQNDIQPKPGKAPKVNINKPQSFVLKNGLKVMVVEDHKLPRVAFNLSLDNPPFAEGIKKGVNQITSSLIGNGSKTISKDHFNEEIDFLGANVNFSLNGAYANSLSKYAYRILELIADAVLNPNFTQVEFDKEKAKIIEGLKAEEKSIPAIANRVSEALIFGKNHPFGEFLTLESLNNVTLADVQSNYNHFFVPENAYLVIIGDVKFTKVKAAVKKLFGSWQKKTIAKVNYPDPINVSKTEINFVDMPNAVQSEISLLNTVNLKMTDPDYFPTIIANHILGGDFNSFINMNLREKNAWTYGANSSIGAGKYVSKFKSTSAVRNAVTDSAVVEFLNEINRIRAEKVSEELLSNIKAGFIGRFVMQVQKPQSIARYALYTEIENLPEDFYANYIKSINAVTSEEVQLAANKFILADNMRIVIVGKGSEVISGLEKLNLPISYFDKQGNPIEKPDFKEEPN